MKLQKVPAPLHIVEFAQVAPETVGGRTIVPMQLFHHSGRIADCDNRVFVVSGFQGPTKHDTHISSLLQKALTKGAFSPIADVWMTPVTNPSSDPKNSSLNHQGLDMTKIGVDECAEYQTLIRWIQAAQPKAVLALTIGSTSGLAVSGAPAQVTQRLADLIEKPALDEETVANRPLANLRQWCADQNIMWVELILDEAKKSFDEIRDSDWKRHFGPAIKWLLEGERFNPPKEEALSMEHFVVPALEMPPEFAHLV